MRRVSGTRWRVVGRAVLIALTGLLVSCNATGGGAAERAPWPRGLDDFDQQLAAQRAEIERQRARDPGAGTMEQPGHADGSWSEPLSRTEDDYAAAGREADDPAVLPYRTSALSLGTMYRHGFTERPWVRGGIHLGTGLHPPTHLRHGIRPHPLYSTGHRFGRIYPDRTRGYRAYDPYDYGPTDLRRWYYGYGEHDLRRWYSGYGLYGLYGRYDHRYGFHPAPGSRYYVPRYRLYERLPDGRLDLQRRRLDDRLHDRRLDRLDRRERFDRLRPHERLRLRSLERRRPGEIHRDRIRPYRHERGAQPRPVPRHEKLHDPPESGTTPQRPGRGPGSNSRRR